MTLRRFHLWATVGWAAGGGVLSFLLATSVAWVVFMSLYAIVISHWSAYQASRAEDAVNNSDTAGG